MVSMAENKIMPKVPDNDFLVELSKQYKEAIFLNSDVAKKEIETANQRYSPTSDEEKIYWNLYKATAMAIALDSYNIEEIYKMKRGHIFEERNCNLNKTREVRDQEILFVDDVTKILTKYGIVGRALPLAFSWFMTNLLESAKTLPRVEWLPETIAVSTFCASHVILSRYGRDKKTKIIENHTKKQNEIEDAYIKDLLELEKWKDKKKERVYKRGERKIMKAYEKYFDIELDPKFSSEKYDPDQHVI